MMAMVRLGYCLVTTKTYLYIYSSYCKYGSNVVVDRFYSQPRIGMAYTCSMFIMELSNLSKICVQLSKVFLA